MRLLFAVTPVATSNLTKWKQNSDNSQATWFFYSNWSLASAVEKCISTNIVRRWSGTQQTTLTWTLLRRKAGEYTSLYQVTINTQKNPSCPLNLILIMTKTYVITYFRGYNCVPFAKVHTWTIDRNRTRTLSACTCSLWVDVGCFENYISLMWCGVVCCGFLLVRRWQ